MAAPLRREATAARGEPGLPPFWAAFERLSRVLVLEINPLLGIDLGPVLERLALVPAIDLRVAGRVGPAPRVIPCPAERRFAIIHQLLAPPVC